MRRFLICLFAFVFVFLPAIGVQASTLQAQPFYYQSVMEDLSSITGDDAFDLSAYPYDFSMMMVGTPQIVPITLFECLYGSQDASAGLYFYFYNPTNYEFSRDVRNSITLSFGENGSQKFPLKILSCGGDDQGHDRLFVKTYVEGSRDLFTPGMKTRSYWVTEVELCLSSEDYNAHSYEVDCAWNYTGSVLDNTLSVSCERLNVVISFEINSCVYRIDDGSGFGTMHQIDSVYFAVPNYLFEEYNGINGVHLNYYEYDSGWLLGLKDDYKGVGQSSTFYDIYKPLEGVDWESYDEDIGVLYSLEDKSLSNNPTNGFTEAYWMFNKPSWFISGAPQIVADRLNYVFSYPEEIDSKTFIETGVKDYISEAWVKFNRGEEQHIFTGAKEDHLVDDWVWSDELVKYNIYSPAFLEKMIYLLFGASPELGSYTSMSVPPIQTVDKEALEDIEGNLYVDSYYSSALKEAYKQAATSDCQLMLLHFDQSQYFSDYVHEADAALDFLNDEVGFVARENIYMDFDILDLSFEGDGENIIIPVAASPINVISPLQSPIDDGWPWWVYLLIVLAVLLLLSLLFGGITVVVKVLLLPVKLAVWLLKALGKGIGALFRRKNE